MDDHQIISIISEGVPSTSIYFKKMKGTRGEFMSEKMGKGEILVYKIFILG